MLGRPSPCLPGVPCQVSPRGLDAPSPRCSVPSKSPGQASPSGSHSPPTSTSVLQGVRKLSPVPPSGEWRAVRSTVTCGVCSKAGLEEGPGVRRAPASRAPQWEAGELCPGPSRSGRWERTQPLCPAWVPRQPQPAGASPCLWVVEQPREKGRSEGRKSPRNVWQTKCRRSTGQEAQRPLVREPGLGNGNEQDEDGVGSEEMSPGCLSAQSPDSNSLAPLHV